MNDWYPRDLRGHGRRPPHPRWPGDARLALSFVLNVEEGGERSPRDGDRTHETYLHDLAGAAPRPGRHTGVESLFDYGARAGLWRLLRLFEGHRLPLTAFAVGRALERNPEAGAALAELGHEVAGHGYRWIDYRDVPAGGGARPHPADGRGDRGRHRPPSGGLVHGPGERPHPPPAGGGGRLHLRLRLVRGRPALLGAGGAGGAPGGAVLPGHQRHAVRHGSGDRAPATTSSRSCATPSTCCGRRGPARRR